MSKHTPGPWQLAYMGAGGWKVSNANWVESLRSVGMTKEDARLIAAAPELLQALKGMTSMYDSENKSTKHTSECPCYHCKARTAIAKAEGQS
jgi:hypothetical protein